MNVELIPMEEVIKLEENRKRNEEKKLKESLADLINGSLYDIMCDRMNEYRTLKEEKTILEFARDLNDNLLDPDKDQGEKIEDFVDLITDFIKPYINGVAENEVYYNDLGAIEEITENYKNIWN